ncbi:MAG: hypothetical protein FWG53_03775 [Clostridiales bacterium]|nr:hypothetical protein [Clostridiales bacterium]
MKKTRLKTLLAFLLFLVLLLVTVSGAMLFSGRTGVVLGVSRASLLHFHFHCALLFTVLGLCHFALNFKQFAFGLRKFFKG